MVKVNNKENCKQIYNEDNMEVNINEKNGTFEYNSDSIYSINEEYNCDRLDRSNIEDDIKSIDNLSNSTNNSDKIVIRNHEPILPMSKKNSDKIVIRNYEPILPMSKNNSEEIVIRNHEPILPMSKKNMRK